MRLAMVTLTRRVKLTNRIWTMPLLPPTLLTQRQKSSSTTVYSFTKRLAN
jgi:hypothetical protein